MANHIIQIVGLQKKKNIPLLKTIGLIIIEDNKYVVFNPSVKGIKDLHWTLHEDGKFHVKQKGNIITSHQKIPLKNLKKGFQFLFSSTPSKQVGNSINYKLRGEEYGLFLVDLTNFKKGVGISIHISDTNHVNKCFNTFKNKPEHQCFIYWKSKPKIIIHVFDN